MVPMLSFWQRRPVGYRQGANHRHSAVFAEPVAGHAPAKNKLGNRLPPDGSQVSGGPFNTHLPGELWKPFKASPGEWTLRGIVAGLARKQIAMRRAAPMLPRRARRIANTI